MPGATESDNLEAISPHRRLLFVLGLALVPWTVLIYDGGISTVFPWGLATVPPFGVTTIFDYVFTYTREVPQSLQGWPLSSGVYACALASASGAIWWREDRRLTAGLLVLAALSHLGFTVAIWHPSQVVVPVGPLLVVILVWTVYWRDLRSIVA